MGFLPSSGLTKVHTWLVYMEFILDFMALSYFSELILDIAST
jgi:hypothetical protein